MVTRLLIEHIPTAALPLAPRNPCTHSARQVRQIAASIREFCFTNQVLIDEANQLIAGHCRLEAAKLLLVLEHVPAILLNYLSETQVETLLEIQRNSRPRLEEIVAERGWLTSGTLEGARKDYERSRGETRRTDAP